MRKLTIFLFSVLITIGLFAQNQTLRTGKISTKDNETILTSQQNTLTTIRFDLAELELIEVDTGSGKAFIPTSTQAPLMLEEGSPELFYMTASFIIPDTGASELEISYGEFRDYENIEIAPSKGNIPRSIDPNTIPYKKGEVYKIDYFYPGSLATLREPFIMRDFRGQSVDVFPLQYNPITKVLRVFSEITVTVINTNEVGFREFTGHKRHKTIDPEFDAIYNNLFINHSGVINERGYPTGEDGEILIICHGAFMTAMQPYVDWKRTIGRKTTLVNVSAVGALNSTNIWTYIKNYYDNPANNLAYVLLVGDFAEIPPRVYSSGQHDHSVVSNNYFGQLSGTSGSPSIYLDVLVGRMSAQSVAHVQTQVERTIWYERDIETSDTWLSAAIGIATNEGGSGGHDGGEIDYVHMNNIRTRLLNYGYNPVYQEYGANSGVTTTTTTAISSRFNSGVGMANYCNHGSETAWTLSSGSSYINYGVSQVNALTNTNKLSYIFSVACLNGRFNYTYDCFAEAWMRRVYNSQPAGAVATLMASVSIAWAPPMTAQDEFVNICMDLASPYPGNGVPGIKRTFAGAALNATQKMILRHGTGAYTLGDYNAWNVFGDPSLMIRTKTPLPMAVTYNPTIIEHYSQFQINCDVDGASVTISRIENSEVIISGTGIVSSNIANITLNSAVNISEVYTIAVTARDRVTHIGTITVEPAGPFTITLESNPLGAGTLDGDGVYPYQAPVSITAEANPTYRFENWTENDVLLTTNPTYSFTASEDKTFTANFVKQYEVIYSQPENGTLTVLSGSTPVPTGTFVDVNTVLTINAIPDEGFTLVNITINGTPISGNTYEIVDETTVACTFTSLQYQITYSHFGSGSIEVLNGEDPILSGQWVDYNTEITITAIPAPGFAISSLMVNGSPFTNGNTHIVTTTVSIACLFTQIPTVTITGYEPENGEIWDNFNPNLYDHAIIKFSGNIEGSTLAGIIVNGAAPVAVDIHPTYNSWLLIYYDFTWGTEYEIIVPAESITGYTGADIVYTFTTPPNIEITLLLPNDNALDVDLDAEVSVEFNKNVYSHPAYPPVITIQKTGGGLVSGVSYDPIPQSSPNNKLVIYHDNFEYDSEYTVTIPVTAIMQWDEPIVWSFTTVSAPTYTIVASVDGLGGTITPSGNVPVVHGQDKDFEINAYPGYYISEVLVNGINVPEAVSSGTYTFINVTTDNQIIMAKFEAEECNPVEYLTIDGNSFGGTLYWDAPAGSGFTYNVYHNGTQIAFEIEETFLEVTLTLYEDHEFCVIVVCPVGESSPVCLTVTPPKYVVSYVQPENGTLEVISNGEPLSSGTYVFYGTELTITATPNDGFELENIYVNGEVLTGNNYTVMGHTEIECVILPIIEECFPIEDINWEVDYGTLIATLTWEASPQSNKYNIYYNGNQVAIEIEETTFQYQLTLTQNNEFSITVVCIGGESEPCYLTIVSPQFAVTYQQPENGTLEVTSDGNPIPNHTFVFYGTELTISATPNEGYNLDNIYVNDEPITGNTYIVIGEIEIVCAFNQIQYSITASVIGNGGSISPNGTITVNWGSDYRFDFIPENGYEILLVFIDNSENSQAVIDGYFEFIDIIDNHTIEVEFSDLGIKNNNSSSLSVYPNPTNGKFSVVNSETSVVSSEISVVSIEILDIAGRLVHREPFPVHRSTVYIDISHLASGIYFVKIGGTNVKVVKQ